MNWFDWTILVGVVVLWLRLEVLFHKHDVLRTEHVSVRNSVACLYRDRLSWDDFCGASKDIYARLDKLDPPRRRSTDKKAAKR